MKRITIAIGAAVFILSCNNGGEPGRLSSDSLRNDDLNQKDANDHNPIIYDSTRNRKDTSSYERMINKSRDSMPD